MVFSEFVAHMSAANSEAGALRTPIVALPTTLGAFMTAPAKTSAPRPVRRSDTSTGIFEGRNGATTKIEFAGSEDIVGEARQEWVSLARCREIDPDDLFVHGAAQRQVAVICRHCPVVLQCRADALDNRVEFGVWGGMTERQRRSLLRQYPNVESWADFFAKQREREAARARRQTQAAQAPTVCP